MEWMLVCCLWIYLGTAAALVKKQVQIGDPVTLDCDINVKNNGHYEIEWRTLDRMVAKSVNGILTPGCGFKDRLYLDGVSLTITHTQYDDHGQYECWYDGHQKSWSLQIDIHNNLTTTVGQPVWIPCYEKKLKKCSKDGRANEISFEWWKDKNPVPVFQMEKGARVAKGRAEESPDVKQGNFSLVFHKAYFSDSGTYRCSEQEESTILRMKVHKVEVNVSIEQSLSLHLYTVDPVEVYFQKDNSNYPVRLCGPDHQCLQNWEYNNNTQTIELDAVKREHLGIYTVKDIQKKCVFCKYILISLPNFVSTESRVVYIRIGFCLLFFVIVCAIICKKLKYCKSRVKYMSCPVGNSGTGGREVV